MKKFLLRDMPEDLHHRLSVFCAIIKKSMKQFILEAIQEKLDRDEQ